LSAVIFRFAANRKLRVTVFEHMSRLRWFVGALASIIFSAAAPALAQPPVDFGVPPSGEVPILFNDHHVYVNDRVHFNRVMAALVRGNVILVPLRSMLEQTGAIVSWDPATQTVVASKPGANMMLTVGRTEIVFNGERRAIDVPPEIYHGDIMVPLRVISEGMGAYVQWVPDKRVVIVRYAGGVAPPPPPAAPPPPPAVAPPPYSAPPPGPPPPPRVPPPPPAPPPIVRPPAPVVVATPPYYDRYLNGNYMIAPSVHNELSSGNVGRSSYMIDGGLEFPVGGTTLALEGDYRHLEYRHRARFSCTGAGGGPVCANVGNGYFRFAGLCPSSDQGCVTLPDYLNLQARLGLRQFYVPAFTAKEDDLDLHLGVKIFDPRVYIGAGYYWKWYNYLGYPTIGGAGFGVSKLADLDRPISIDGSLFYYPMVTGNFTYPTSGILGSVSGSTVPIRYHTTKYKAGLTVKLGNSGLHLNVGFAGEGLRNAGGAPSNTTVAGAYAGVGIHF
jgi:hypothetical protein